ncbi:hypothetical protein MXD59_06695 [Frankia sp. Ag45/Mut15]|uniref:Uncharacterized protein n=1 Tax=Frankia umida TaxID=573489 RepID=A0ABT0JVE4_9ACTN|nr:hypothetical protein [Frankia umida]MCK9875466.1 hypothetical protein [Frankia umida]
MSAVATARALLGPTFRSTKYHPLLVGTALGLAVAAVPAATGTDLDSGSWTGLLRFSAIINALGFTFVLDDLSAPTTSVLPVPRLWRNLLRVASALPVTVICWVAAAAIAKHGLVHQRMSLPLRLPGLTLEATTILVLAIALTAAISRVRPDGSVGLVAAPVFLATVGALYALPGSAALFVASTSARWEEAHQVWGLLLALLLVTAGLLGREPRPRRRRAARGPQDRAAGSRGDPHLDVTEAVGRNLSRSRRR